MYKQSTMMWRKLLMCAILSVLHREPCLSTLSGKVPLVSKVRLYLFLKYKSRFSDSGAILLNEYNDCNRDTCMIATSYACKVNHNVKTLSSLLFLDQRFTENRLHPSFLYMTHLYKTIIVMV